MDNHLDDLIANYLAETLDPESRREFELRLAAEPELAARVALEQDLAGTLDTASVENQLRANLRSISAKFDTPESLEQPLEKASGSKTRLIWWLMAGLLLSTGLIYWMMSQKESPAIPLPPPPQDTESPTTAPKTTEESFPEPKETEKNTPVNKPKPMATAFQPIKRLESYIGSQVRSGDFRLRVDEPRSDATLPLKSGITAFRFSGNVEGGLPSGKTINLLIFTNNLQDFEAMRPVESQLLEVNRNGDFLFKKSLPLSPGLYYYLIEDSASGEWLIVDKFWVK